MIADAPTTDLIPPLSAVDLARLKASIQEKGIMEPVVEAYDDPDHEAPDGEVIDGKNRKAIAAELGIECPIRRVSGLNADDRRQMAFSLNFHRRHLSLQQQRDIGREIQRRLEVNPLESDRRIAGLLGIHHETVGRQRKQLESQGTIPATTIPPGVPANAPGARVLTDHPAPWQW